MTIDPLDVQASIDVANAVRTYEENKAIPEIDHESYIRCGRIKGETTYSYFILTNKGVHLDVIGVNTRRISNSKLVHDKIIPVKIINKRKPEACTPMTTRSENL